PLAEKDIPLYVRSFVEPATKGTMIGNCETTPAQPAFITKKNQALVTFKKSDLSSISQREMVDIINGAARLNLKINLMQNAASEFSFSTNYDAHALERLQKESRLVNQFAIEVETGLQILTLKNYDTATLAKFTEVKGEVLRQTYEENSHILYRV
ncbi:MAG: aspartate kinase, partial [Bacteroidota bacterium]